MLVFNIINEGLKMTQWQRYNDDDKIQWNCIDFIQIKYKLNKILKTTKSNLQFTFHVINGDAKDNRQRWWQY